MIVSQQFNELLDKISFNIARKKHSVEDVSHDYVRLSRL